MKEPKKSAESASLRPLRPVESELIRARAINSNAVLVPGIVMGNRAYLRMWESNRTRSRTSSRPPHQG